MKTFKFYLWVLGLVLMVVGCTPDQPIDEPIDEPTEEPTPAPVEEYLRLNLMSGCGHNAATEDVETTRSAVFDDSKGNGDMSLKWESFTSGNP